MKSEYHCLHIVSLKNGAWRVEASNFQNDTTFRILIDGETRPGRAMVEYMFILRNWIIL